MGLKHWAEELSAEQAGQSTLQYELIEALLGLRSQGIRDGCANWGGGSVEMLDLLRAHLPFGSQRDRILADLKQIQVSAETEGHFAYDEIDRLPSDLLRWCIERPQWIHLPDGYLFWLDVPRDAVTPDAGRAISPLSGSLMGCWVFYAVRPLHTMNDQTKGEQYGCRQQLEGYVSCHQSFPLAVA